MSTTEIKIETNQILGDFKSHLNIDNNNRILFSGPFGTGKSTFLKEFTDINKTDYYAVKIYPVHYSVASNEDVFELIKYDILFHLFNEKEEILKLKKEDFSKFLKAQMFVLNRMKFKPLLYSILELSGKIGTPVINFIKELNNAYDDFKDYDKETKIDEKQLIVDYLQSIENSPGNIKEFDSNSQLISELLKRVKSKEVEKPLKKVLIIDDLDRLDPEHIFRLFNVFSAHHDEVTNTNKFGFDKVIFVCDIENIRKIFHHRYGSEVDFSGYIDKYYSVSPYDFDNRNYVKEKIDNFLQKISFNNSIPIYNFESSDSRFSTCMKSILHSLIDLKVLNLRMLIQCTSINIENKIVQLKHNVSEYIQNLPILVIFNILKNYFGSYDVLYEKLDELAIKFNHSNFKSENNYRYNNLIDINNLISFSLPFLLPTDKAFFDITNTEVNCYLEKYDVTVFYKGLQDNLYGQVNYQQASKGKSESGFDIITLNPYQILLDTFDECRKRGFLN